MIPQDGDLEKALDTVVENDYYECAIDSSALKWLARSGRWVDHGVSTGWYSWAVLWTSRICSVAHCHASLSTHPLLQPRSV